MIVKESNKLFPVFLKLEELQLLIVGGGNVGLEKLNAVLQNSPAAGIRLVAISITDEIKRLAVEHTNVILEERAFETSDLDEADLVIVAVNDPGTSEVIKNEAKAKGKLVNVADKPQLCDFLFKFCRK